MRAVRTALEVATSCRYLRLAHERAGPEGLTPNGLLLENEHTTKDSRKRDKSRCFAKCPRCLTRQGQVTDCTLLFETCSSHMNLVGGSIVAMRSLPIRRLSNFAGRQAKPLRMLVHPDNTTSGGNRTQWGYNQTTADCTGQKSG